jgi:2-dehydro-3-deoxyphosphogluconate aldolase / (4S)-4-hydroxy-2-oxoglutarate aldolase
MHETLKKLGEIGVIPVVKIEKASDAVNMGKALLAGELPVVEITFRTAAAEGAIRNLVRHLPELLIGAGTILTVEQAKIAIAAGAEFIVTPGFNPKVVDYCISEKVPVTPGISSPSEIEMALERGLDVVKVFPAGALGGVPFLKAISAPYGGIRFIPTGGVDPSNLGEYLSFNRVHAVGGTWIAKESTISAGNFGEITQLAREAISLSLGFEHAHVGINGENPQIAAASAEMFSRLFSFVSRDGTSSIFAGAGLEFMKTPYLGMHGHLAISTLSIARAEAYLKRKGVGVRPETAKERDGNTIAIYLDREIAGFAIHLLQK